MLISVIDNCSSVAPKAAHLAVSVISLLAAFRQAERELGTRMLKFLLSLSDATAMTSC